MNKIKLTKIHIAILVVITLIAGLLFGHTINDKPKLQDPYGGKLQPQGRATNASINSFYSVTDDLPCMDTVPITGDNQTKAKATWYASGGGLADSLARAGQTNANTNDSNLVYEASRTQRGLIVMAIACGDDALLQSIGESWTNILNSRVMYSPALGGRPGGNYLTWLIYNTAGSPPYGGSFNIAYMYTMVWNMASILAYIARITPGSRTAWQSAFVTRWAPVMKAEYNHLMMEINWPASGGDCDGPFSFSTYGTSISGKEQQVARFAAQNWGSATQDKSWCNFIRDAEQAIHAGFAEFTRAHISDPTNIPITGSSLTLVSMKKINSLMSSYYQANSATTTVTNLAGATVTGRFIAPEAGWFRPNPAIPGNYFGLATENGWANDTDASRSPANPPCAPGRAFATYPTPVGSDVSHENLQFYYLLSIRSLNDVAGMTDQIPTTFMAQLANQFAYGIANKSLTFPKFRNYTSGANGWYRSAYANAPGSPPWESGTRGAQAGHYMWGTYNEDIVTYAARWKQIWEAPFGTTDFTWRVANLEPGGGKWSGCTYYPDATLNLNINNPYSHQMFYPSMAKYVSNGAGGPATTTTTTATTTTTTIPSANDACPGSRTCVFPANPTPSAIAGGDGQPIQYGLKVSSSAPGSITHVRYYRYGGDSSTRTIRIYTGGVLATPAFTTAVTTEGWRNVALPTPLNISAGITYVVTVDSPTGVYPYTYDVFTSSSVTSGVLTSPQTAAEPNGNGVYGPSGLHPTYTYRGISYGVDVAYNAAAVTTTTSGPTTTTTTTTTIAPAGTFCGNGASRWGATATASSGADAANVTDANVGTQWNASTGSVPQWVRLELGQPRLINSVSVQWVASRGAKQWTIQTSTDGLVWTTRRVVSGYNTNATSRCYTSTSLGVTARYIRVNASTKETAAGANPLAMFEFGAFA